VLTLRLLPEYRVFNRLHLRLGGLEIKFISPLENPAATLSVNILLQLAAFRAKHAKFTHLSSRSAPRTGTAHRVNYLVSQSVNFTLFQNSEFFCHTYHTPSDHNPYHLIKSSSCLNTLNTMPPFRGLGSSPPGVRKDGHRSIAGKSVLGSSHPQGRGKGSRGFGVGGKGQKRHR
jgi:hypothetical protein